MKPKLVISIVAGGVVLAGLIAMLPSPDPDAAMNTIRVVQPPVVLNPGLQNAGNYEGLAQAGTSTLPDSPTIIQVGMTVINGVLYVITADNQAAAAAASAAAKAAHVATPTFQCDARGVVNGSSAIVQQDYTAWAMGGGVGAGSMSAPAPSLTCALVTGTQQ